MRFYIFIVLAFCMACTGNNSRIIPVIPQPRSVVSDKGFFRMPDKLLASYPDDAASVIAVFSDGIKEYAAIERSDSENSGLLIIIGGIKGEEAYSLKVSRKNITINSGTLHGAFNGLQSLHQLVIAAEQKGGKILIPCCTIEDHPLYSWRGLMLDESRHFFGMEKVKEMLNIMALHKLNTFHWHLTDVAGWRMEVKKYPLLSQTGGIGNHTDIMAPTTFYTQEQIKEIVNYASERFIRVIPEIDMPGHAGSSNKAYPEFSGGGSESYPEFTFNPGKEGTYGYLTDILREVKGMFPSEYIHIGGDEVNFGNQQWNTMPEVRSLMKKNKLDDLKAVERYFVTRMSDSVNKLDRITIGWDEIAGFGLDPRKAVVMWWRHDKPDQLKTALEGNYKIVMCPRIPLYFDFVQDSTHKLGRRWRGTFCQLANVYSFPPDTLQMLKDHKSQVLGMQANIWSEMIGDNKRLDFMTYPRLSALSEAAWTEASNKNYGDFLIRLKPMLRYLNNKGIYYFDIFNPTGTPEPAAPVKRKY